MKRRGVAALLAALCVCAVLPGALSADPSLLPETMWIPPFSDLRMVSEAPETWLQIGEKALADGDIPSAFLSFDLAFTIAVASNDKSAAAKAAVGLGKLSFGQLGRDESGVKMNQRVTRIFRAFGATATLQKLAIELGEIHRLKGDLADAEEQYGAALATSGQSGRELEIARDYLRLSRSYFAAGEFGGAIRARHKAGMLDPEAHDRPDLGEQLAALDAEALQGVARIIAEKGLAPVAALVREEDQWYLRRDGQAKAGDTPNPVCDVIVLARDRARRARDFKMIDTCQALMKLRRCSSPVGP